MRSVLVTGGAGYVGSHACKALARAGYLPVAYDNLSKGHADLVKWGPLEIGDIADGDRLDVVMAQWRPMAIMHFAALSEVGQSVRDPALYYRVNVAGTLSLLDAARRHDVDRFILSSTAATYGIPSQSPVPESAPAQPINPYGISKRTLELVLADYEVAYGLRWVALRYFNASGADPEMEAGEDHRPESHLIPRTIFAATGLAEELQLFGTDYPTADGTCIRDYIHVTDLADGHVRALAALDKGLPSQALNLGTGKGCSTREVIRAVERVTGLQVPVTNAPRRAGDPPELVADPSRAMASLGFDPKFSDIQDIVATAYRWHLHRHIGRARQRPLSEPVHSSSAQRSSAQRSPANAAATTRSAASHPRI
jgi:UDP-glucose-4-epimerase GalE